MSPVSWTVSAQWGVNMRSFPFSPLTAPSCAGLHIFPPSLNNILSRFFNFLVTLGISVVPIGISAFVIFFLIAASFMESFFSCWSDLQLWAWRGERKAWFLHPPPPPFCFVLAWRGGILYVFGPRLPFCCPLALINLWGRKGDAKLHGSHTQRCPCFPLATCNLSVFGVANILDLTFSGCIRITDTSARRACSSCMSPCGKSSPSQTSFLSLLVVCSSEISTGHGPLTL